MQKAMGGRVKRMIGVAEAEARRTRQPEEASCALCGRQLGPAVERHHLVPRSEGGTETVAVHPICHRTIHAFVTNRELATSYATLDQLKEREDVRRFLRWIAGKPPSFRAPTRRRNIV
jgi:5-methylcytosine-specific restriction endonuclease McrA